MMNTNFINETDKIFSILGRSLKIKDLSILTYKYASNYFF